MLNLQIKAITMEVVWITRQLRNDVFAVQGIEFTGDANKTNLIGLQLYVKSCFIAGTLLKANAEYLFHCLKQKSAQCMQATTFNPGTWYLKMHLHFAGTNITFR